MGIPKKIYIAKILEKKTDPKIRNGSLYIHKLSTYRYTRYNNKIVNTYINIEMYTN